MTKVVYDDKSRNIVFNNLNNCINLLKDINNILYNVNVPLDFSNRNEFNNKILSFKNIEKKIVNYKDNYCKCIENINKNELEIASMFNNIDDLIVNKF